MSSALRSYSTWKMAKGALFALPKQMPGTCLLSLSKHLCQDISSSAYCPHETMGLTFFSPPKCCFKLNAATKPREESYKLTVRGISWWSTMNRNSKEEGRGSCSIQAASLNLNAQCSLFNLDSHSLSILCPSLPFSIHPAHQPPGLRSLLLSGNSQSTRSGNHPVSYRQRKAWVTALSEDLLNRGRGGLGKKTRKGCRKRFGALEGAGCPVA